ncbi:MAG: alpha-L-fucosidase [Bacteroidales bacterium]|nr:alpha-L-fucosidase [Bacteroidales bacterium]
MAVLLCAATLFTQKPILLPSCRRIPVPTKAQLEWQEMEMNMFCHFGPNTFSGVEWGSGQEADDLFNPTEMDCRQWAATAKAAGFKGIIITAKHHDGFCLWPNPESTHTVAQSSWKNGQGDVLKELSEACLEYGLKFGVYISPWDRNDPRYGTPDYNMAFARTLENVHDGRYGDIFEQWFDGACGEGPDGKRQEYDWTLFTGTVRRLHPLAIMFSDVGPDCRWVGNELGYAGETNWSTLSPEGFTPGAGSPPVDTLNSGNVHGTFWIPAEADVSIRPGWFWKESDTQKLKSVDELMDIYFGSVGRNAVLLLNVPPDTRGRIPEADSLRLMEFKARRDDIFSKEAADRFNIVCLREEISRGQRVAEFAVDAFVEGEWTEIAHGTTIGYKRLLKVPTVNSNKVRVRVLRSYGKPHLGKTSLYYNSLEP